MAWPGRGQGAYQPSQAWFFATPEEVHGKRVNHDTLTWGPSPTPTMYETRAREFSTQGWDIGTRLEGHRDGKKGLASARTALDVPKEVKSETQAKCAAKTRVKRKAGTPIQVQATRDADDSKIRVDGKAASSSRTSTKTNRKKSVKVQQTTVTGIDSDNRIDTNDKVEEKPGRAEGAPAKVKRKKKKMAGSQKVTDKTATSKAGILAQRKEPEAQEVAGIAAFTMAPRKGDIRTQTQPTESTGIITASVTKKVGFNGDRSSLRENTDNANSIEEYVSLFDLVRDTVSKYRIQSPAHFALHIDVQLSDTDHKTKREGPRTQLNITFQNYSREFHWLCKRSFQKGRPTRKVMVCNRRSQIPLKKLLAEHFPVSEAITSDETLRNFWHSNNRSFNWDGLPTELKEHIIQFCIVAAPRHPDHFHDITSVKQFIPMNTVRSCELVDRLSWWKSLLRVSPQVRAITLRLCFNGSLIFDKGLCITSYSLFDFSARFSDLERYSQITEPNSVPLSPDDPSYLLMEVYRDTPKLYPELKRFGTFSHGIRKVDISFDFVNFYRFFEVKAGNFGREGHPRCACTYNVFEKMPYLNTLVIRLPKNRKKDWVNKCHQIERPLFHTTFPCPRIIFRILYERIAEALAAYLNVSVKNFLDESEEERFWSLRQTAMKALQDATPPKPVKLSMKELEEIGMHSGGGLQLNREELQHVCQAKYQPVVLQKDKQEVEELLGQLSQEDSAVEQFYPIRCECAVSCREQYDFHPDW